LWDEAGDSASAVPIPRRDPQARPELRAAPGDSPQGPRHVLESKFFGEAATNGKLDAVWAAHSCDSSGQIDIYGKPLATAEDYRLRRTLVRAGWHFLTRTGRNPL